VWGTQNKTFIVTVWEVTTAWGEGRVGEGHADKEWGLRNHRSLLLHQKLKASGDDNGFPNLEPRQRPAEHRERVADVLLESRKAGARGRRAIQTVHGSSGVSVLGGIRCGQYIGKVSRGREQGAHCVVYGPWLQPRLSLSFHILKTGGG
jgi:hypothetical protein